MGFNMHFHGRACAIDKYAISSSPIIRLVCPPPPPRDGDVQMAISKLKRPIVMVKNGLIEQFCFNSVLR